MLRILTCLLLASLAACTSQPAPTVSPHAAKPASPRLFETRLATQDEVDRAIALVRAHEALRGRQHHIDTVASQPLSVSDWVVNDSILLRWREPWEGNVFPISVCTMFGEETRYEYTVNLATAKVEMAPDYWLQDVRFQWVPLVREYRFSFESGNDDDEDASPPLVEPLLDLSVRSCARFHARILERAITVVRAEATLDGDPIRIQCVAKVPWVKWYDPTSDIAHIEWLRPAEMTSADLLSGTLVYLRDRYSYTVKLATNDVSLVIRWLNVPFWTDGPLDWYLDQDPLVLPPIMSFR